MKWFWAKISNFRKFKNFRALQLRRRRRNCDARKYLNFLKFEIFAQNHFIFLKKLKRPKNLSYRKEQNLVLWEFFLCLFHLKKINLYLTQIWEGFTITMPASQLRRRPDCNNARIIAAIKKISVLIIISCLPIMILIKASQNCTSFCIISFYIRIFKDLKAHVGTLK